LFYLCEPRCEHQIQRAISENTETKNWFENIFKTDLGEITTLRVANKIGKNFNGGGFPSADMIDDETIQNYQINLIVAFYIHVITKIFGGKRFLSCIGVIQCSMKDFG
jgi:hypothetical protein